MVGHIIIIVPIISITFASRFLTGEACPTSRRHERGIFRLGTPPFFSGAPRHCCVSVTRIVCVWGSQKGGDQEALIADYLPTNCLPEFVITQ